MKTMFDEIWEVYFKSKELGKSYILKNKDDTSFNVDLTDGCFFIDCYEIEKVTAKFMVENIQDVYDFCKEKNIEIEKTRLKKDGILAGGEVDYFINNDLVGHWISEITFDEISKNEEKKLDDSYAKFAEKLKSEFGDSIEDAETFNVLVNYQSKQILEIYVKDLLGKELEEEKLEEMTFLYLNYGFMEANVNDLIERREGTLESIDKTRWVLQQYKEFIVNKELPNMNQEHQEDFLSKPNFGAGEDWIEFCKSLSELFQGKPWRYIKILNFLILIGSNHQ